MRSHTSKKDLQYNDKKKKDKGQTTFYKTLHGKLKVEQRHPHVTL